VSHTDSRNYGLPAGFKDLCTHDCFAGNDTDKIVFQHEQLKLGQPVFRECIYINDFLSGHSK